MVDAHVVCKHGKDAARNLRVMGGVFLGGFAALSLKDDACVFAVKPGAQRDCFSASALMHQTIARLVACGAHILKRIDVRAALREEAGHGHADHEHHRLPGGNFQKNFVLHRAS